MTTPDIYIVDDDKAMRKSTRQWLELSGYRATDFDRAGKVLDIITPDMNGIIISDVKMPGMDGLDFQKALAAIDPDIPVILITAHGDISMAVEAIRNGAYDFLEKPFEPERILDSVQRAAEKRRLVMENRELRSQLTAAQGLDARLVGGNPRMRALKQQIMGLAPTEATVMIIGDTGTGKEVVARCLHDWSRRKDAPFLAVNCAAIPATMAESELFGYEAGAFTGARQSHRGKLEAAAGGTLFLDELSSMPLEIQGKLLRALESRRVTRLGSNTPKPLDFRLITAMNITPEEAIDSDKLRKDLYYRLNTMELIIPSLRDRKEDISPLFSLFLERAAEMYDCRPDMPGPAGFSALMAHDWPGNVRELKSVAERYVLSNLAREERLSKLLAPDTSAEDLKGASLPEQVRHFERHLIKDALKRHNGQINKVMAELGIPRRTLNEKMSRYSLSKENF
ncbi:MAG: sigma-54 dependent transcriptional regulator [Desulfobacterales bacterium]|nr:sigma-54 dependent transcriptional regulator [Desulfobacterales bacterium]